MATYSPASLGIKPPSGGFQEGGWYNGRQYFGGTLSDPGVIHPSSSQQGAGQAVSQEVVAQTNPNNVAYVNQQRQQAQLPALNNAPSASTLPGGSYDSSGANAGLSGGIGPIPQASINLPELYNSLTQSSGIRAKQDELSTMEKQYIEATGKINDNPFVSEATRIGKVAKLDELYQKRTANLRGDIATTKADIETQINLQTKQFDINSQQAELAFSHFNSLLQSGGLDSANGDDIAAITRTTGIPSSIIYSAINANKAKNVKTETIKFDDGTNQGFAIVNSQTGEIISKQAVAASEPKKTTGGGSSTSNKQNYSTWAKNDAAKGATLQQMIDNYAQAGGLSIDEIYRIYNSSSPRGVAKETLKDVKAGNYATQKGFKSLG